ncbi:trypsin-3-like [Lampetra fluviatilis]
MEVTATAMLSVAAVCTCVCPPALAVGTPRPGTPRIVGGYEVPPYSIKYQASLQRPRGSHFCGGSLVGRQWVVTAAHCNLRLPIIRVVLGENSISKLEGREQFFRAVRTIPHPFYNSRTEDNDIMLLKLNRPATLNAFVGTVGLAEPGSWPGPGTLCRVSGWGLTSSLGRATADRLRAVRVPLVPSAQCNSTLAYNGLITHSMVCAGYRSGGKDSCQGDSGGPLVCGGRLFGVVSWGNSCADSRYPGVYSSIARFRYWIEMTIVRDARRRSRW